MHQKGLYTEASRGYIALPAPVWIAHSDEEHSLVNYFTACFSVFKFIPHFLYPYNWDLLSNRQCAGLNNAPMKFHIDRKKSLSPHLSNPAVVYKAVRAGKCRNNIFFLISQSHWYGTMTQG